MSELTEPMNYALGYEHGERDAAKRIRAETIEECARLVDKECAAYVGQVAKAMREAAYELRALKDEP